MSGRTRGTGSSGGAVLDIGIRADIRNLKANLAEIPGVGEREAKAMVDKMTRQYRKLERATKKSMKRQESSVVETFKSIGEAGDRIGSELGGIFGDIAGGMSTLVESGAAVSSTLGPIGGTAAVLTATMAGLSLGIGFVASAGHEFVASADEMLERMDELNRAPGLSPAALAALQDYHRDAEAAEAATLALRLELAAAIAGAFADAPHAIAGISMALDDLVSSIFPAVDGLQDVAHSARSILMGVSAGMAEFPLAAIDAMVERGREASKTQEDTARTTEDLTIRLDRLNTATRENAAATSEQVDAQDTANQSYAMLLRIQGDLIDAEGRLLLATTERTKAIDELAAAGLSVADAERLHAENMLRLNRELLALDQKRAAEQAQAQKQEATHWRWSAAAAAERQSNQTDILGLTREQNAAIQAGAGLTGQWAAASQAMFDARMDNVDATDRAERKAARQAWRRSKTIARAAATVDAARAAVSMASGLGTLLGPAAIPVAVGAAGGLLAQQMAAIDATPKPQFSLGGMVGDRTPTGDHRIVSARDTEGFLTEQGVGAAGGEAGVRALNEGRAMGGSTVNAVLQVNGRTLGALASEVMRDPRSMAAVQRQSGTVFGRRDPFGRN